MSKQQVIRLSEARRRTPPVDGVATWMAELRQSFFDALAPADIKKMADVLKAKALTGDLAAMKLLLKYAIGEPKSLPLGEPPAPREPEMLLEPEEETEPMEPLTLPVAEESGSPSAPMTTEVVEAPAPFVQP